METALHPLAREIGQVQAYRIDVVEAFLEAAAAERERLQVAVADAHARLVAARDRLAEITELRNRLGTMVLDAQHVVIRRRADVETAVARIVDAAEAEAGAILATARAEAAALRSRAAVRLATGVDEPAPVIDLSLWHSEVG